MEITAARAAGIAHAIAADNESIRPAPPVPRIDRATALDLRVSDSELRAVVRSRYESGHFADAVEAGVKFLVNLVHKRSGCDPDADGTGLMTTVFSVANPVLRVNAGKTKTDRSEQLGYMHLFAGIVAAIRNPRAHASSVEDSPEDALMMLEWTNHLVLRARAARRARSRRT